MKNFILGVLLIIVVIGMCFIFSEDDDSIYRHLPEGEYNVGVISVRVKGNQTLTEILLENEDETGMKGVPVNIQVKEWERFSGRDGNFITAGEDLLIPCYIKK